MDGAADLLLKSYGIEQIANRVREVHSHPQRFLQTDDPEVARIAESTEAETTEVNLHEYNRPGGQLQKTLDKCASNRLVRGVNYLRSWVQGFGKQPLEARSE